MSELLHQKRVVEMISKVVRLGAADVPLGEVWSQLHGLHGVGQIKGRRLLLDAADRKALRSLLMRVAGWDPHVAGPVVAGSRTELAGFTRNEKLSGERVAQELVLVASPDGILRLAQGDQTILPGAALALPASMLEQLPAIIVVENLQPMLDAHRYRLPPALAGVPFVFRGSPQFCPAPVKALAARVSRVFYFPDADPQGLANSLGAENCCGILSCAPEWFAEMHKKGCCKPLDYERQQHLVPGLLATGHPLASIIEKYRAGFSQEAMAENELICV